MEDWKFSDILSAPLEPTARPPPICNYDVLAGSMNGPHVRMSKVGDAIVHRWTCESCQYSYGSDANMDIVS